MPLNYETITEMTTKRKLVSLTCNKCKKTVSHEDEMEFQEAFVYTFTGGYGSVFGDGNRVTICLCQQCLYDTLNDFAVYEDDTESINIS